MLGVVRDGDEGEISLRGFGLETGTTGVSAGTAAVLENLSNKFCLRSRYSCSLRSPSEFATANSLSFCANVTVTESASFLGDLVGVSSLFFSLSLCLCSFVGDFGGGGGSMSGELGCGRLAFRGEDAIDSFLGMARGELGPAAALLCIELASGLGRLGE